MKKIAAPLVLLVRNAAAFRPPLGGGLRTSSTSFVSVGHSPHTSAALARGSSAAWAALLALLLLPACGAEREEVPGPNPPPAPTTVDTSPVAPPAETGAPALPPTPEPTPKLPLAQLEKTSMEALIAAFNAHDAKKLASLYTQDARVGSAGPAGWMEEKGQAAVEEGHKKLFAAFPDLKWASPHVYMTGNVVIQEWVSTGTHKGDLGTTKATGKPVGLHGASVYWYNEDGLITRDDTYYDTATMGVQIGEHKGKARAVPTLPTGEPQFITAGPDADRNVNAAKGLYAAFGKDEKAFMAALAPDVVSVSYAQAEDRKGEKAARDDYQTMVKAFPDVKVTPQGMWGFGDVVISEVTMTGTQTGPLGSIKPTKKAVTTHSLDILRFNANGKVTEMVSYGNSGELMSQLGTSGTEATTPHTTHPTKPPPKK